MLPFHSILDERHTRKKVKCPYGCILGIRSEWINASNLVPQQEDGVVVVGCIVSRIPSDMPHDPKHGRPLLNMSTFVWTQPGKRRCTTTSSPKRNKLFHVGYLLSMAYRAGSDCMLFSASTRRRDEPHAPPMCGRRMGSPRLENPLTPCDDLSDVPAVELPHSGS